MKVTDKKHISNGNKNSVTIQLGFWGENYLRLDIGNSEPTLHFKIMSLVGDFRGRVVKHEGQPMEGKCYICKG